MSDGSDDVTVEEAPLDLIQAAAKEMGEPLSTRDFDEWAVGVSDAANVISRTVGWVDACQAAGVTPAGVRIRDWDKSEIQECIRECARDRGEPISQKAYRDWKSGREAPSLTKIQSEFGGWTSACESTGVEPAGKYKKHSWGRQEIANAIRSADEKTNNRLTREKYSEWSVGNPNVPSTGSVSREFGSWSNAIDEIGFEQEQVCPDCGEPKQRLGSHWARSKDCDYPVPDHRDSAVLDGLMFVGGALNNRERSVNGYLSIAHKDREALAWIADELGVLAASITEYDQARSIDYHGDRPDGPIWELRTRSLPALQEYHRWYDENDERTVPEDVEPRPLLRKTACLLAARPMDDRPGIYLSLRRTRPSETVVDRVFGGCRPSIVENSSGGYVVRIADAAALRDDLAPWPEFAADRFDF